MVPPLACTLGVNIHNNRVDHAVLIMYMWKSHANFWVKQTKQAF